MARIVLVGYGKMLYSLIEGILQTENEIVGVFRNDRIRYTPVELFIKDIFNPSLDYCAIKSFKLNDIPATSVNSDKFINKIKKLNTDLIIVGSWAEKFKSEILSTVPCVNFHPALLPKNRGANPYFWSIYLNQSVTGLTIHYMNEKFDKGDIILQEAITIDENETGETLKNKTTALAKVMVREFLELFNKNQIQPVKQDEKFATYEPQITENEAIVDISKPKVFVSRHLRALYPWTTPYIKVYRRYIPVKKYELAEIKGFEDKKTGEIIEKTKEYFILKGSDFLIKIYK